MGMSTACGPAEEVELVAALHRTLERGVSFFGAAGQYGPYENEALHGRALQGRSQDAGVATKFGSKFESGLAQGVSRELGGIRRPPSSIGGSPSETKPKV